MPGAPLDQVVQDQLRDDGEFFTAETPRRREGAVAIW